MAQSGRFRFEDIEHTADKAIAAYGGTYGEMLESAAAGMFAQAADLELIAPEKKWEVRATADSAEDLLVEWLREVLFLAEREQAVLCDFRIVEFGEWAVKGEVWGSRRVPEAARLGATVKAVTYHNLEAKFTDGEWQGRVTFDV